jgi:signal transduction histidine kinase/CheY-like chemotaxis protein
MLAEGGRDWQRDVLHVALVWTSRLGSILAVALFVTIITREPVRSFDPAVVMIYTAYGGVVALRHRRSLSYRWRAYGFCLLMLVMGVASLHAIGALPGPALACTFVVVGAQLFLGTRVMLLALGLTAAAVVLAGLEHSQGPHWPDAERLGTWFWLREGAGYAVPTAALALILGHVIGRLEESLRAARGALNRSTVAEAERQRTKAALVRTEAALIRSQKLEAVGRLAAGVGHDFNNTLQVMLSWASILREERDKSVFDEGLTAIERAARQGRELTQRLLEFGRRDVRAPVRCSPAKLVKESVRSLRRLLPEDISIELELDEGVPDILVDGDQLAHVLLNLGVNARDAMPAGGVLRFEVSSVAASDLGDDASGALGGRLVRVSVRDTGVGMDGETLGQLFEPFFTTKGERGTGLGLATAHSIVQRNGGFIRVSSEVGKGSTFRLYFPGQGGASASAESPRPQPQRPAKGVVMVAEDDPEVRRSIVRVLGSAGYRVLQSADVTSAMSLLEQRGAEVDLFCTDGIMPGGGTRQLIDHYLACRPDGRVMVCSGYVQEELLRRDLDAGAYVYLPKPFHPAELVERIGRMLEGRS